MKHKHMLICGERGVGKSTLIKKLTAELDVPIAGFVSEKRKIESTDAHGVYINPVMGERQYCRENMAGFCYDKKWDTYPEVFNITGVSLLENKGSIIIMDELGFMEASAQEFTEKVLEILDGSVPVIAAVKARDGVPFLDRVKAHPNCACYTVTAENRDELFRHLRNTVRGWKNSCNQH